MRAPVLLTISAVVVIAGYTRADCTAASRCVTVLATASATSLVAGASSVFWTDAAGSVASVPKVGGAVTFLARNQDGAVLDGTDARRLYWHTPSAVRRMLETGGAIEPLYAYQPGRDRFVDVAVTPRALFVTATTTVWRLALDGTTPQSAPGSFVARRSRTVLFVGSTARAWRSVYRLDDGTEIRIEGNPSLAADTQHGMPALFVLAAHRLVRIEGGRASALATQQDEDGRIAVAGDDVYWTNPRSGFVRKTNVYGGTIDVVAAGQSHPTLIAADSDDVYWASQRAIVRATPR